MQYNFPLQQREIEKRIQGVNAVDYAKTRNVIDGGVTQLSPYITRGVVSLPYVREQVCGKDAVLGSVQDGSAQFIQELAWREYFQRTWQAKGHEIFEDMRFDQPLVDNSQLPQSIADGSTGVKTIDASITALYETGYMHNHARMTVASVTCHLGRSYWKTPAWWMYYHLFDGDPASNMLSWQWVAGTSKSGGYTTCQSLINHWSGTKQTGTILDYNRDEMFKQNKPNELYFLVNPDLTDHVPLRQQDAIDISDGRDILVYHPFHVDPQWRTNHDAHRIFLWDPVWFAQFPVSEKVMNFIIDLAQAQIPGIKIVIGSAIDLPLQLGQKIFTREHPSLDYASTVNTNSDNNPVTIDEREWLFPTVSGYYKSFYAYWKAIEKEYNL